MIWRRHSWNDQSCVQQSWSTKEQGGPSLSGRCPLLNSSHEHQISISHRQDPPSSQLFGVPLFRRENEGDVQLFHSKWLTLAGWCSLSFFISSQTLRRLKRKGLPHLFDNVCPHPRWNQCTYENDFMHVIFEVSSFVWNNTFPTFGTVLRPYSRVPTRFDPV